MVNVAPDPDEVCNRTITVYGQGGKVPGGGTAENPLELFVSNAGTAARFLTALVCLGQGVYRLHGVPRMHERPQKALFQALRELGYRVDAPNDKLPATVYGRDAVSASQISSAKIRDGGTPSLPKECTVSIQESSQFASALLLCAKHGGWKIEVTGENAEESPYVAMTAKLIEVFPHHGGKFQIEPDASSGSYFWASAQIDYSGEERLGAQTHWLGADENFSVRISGWRRMGFQIDEQFFWVFVRLMRDSPFVQKCATEDGFRNLCANWNNAVTAKPDQIKHVSVSRRDDLGDSIMTAIALAPLAVNAIKFKDLGRLRVQECERVVALRTELTKCGAKVLEEGDTLTVYPSKLHGAEIETYSDHRMAMCFAILGLKVRGIKIKNPACVKKTFPNFFQKLAAPPPKGLGATILDVKTGRKLKEEELFAD